MLEIAFILVNSNVAIRVHLVSGPLQILLQGGILGGDWLYKITVNEVCHKKKPGENPWLVKNDYGGLGRDMERCTFDRPLFGAGRVFVSKHLRSDGAAFFRMGQP